MASSSRTRDTLVQPFDQIRWIFEGKRGSGFVDDVIKMAFAERNPSLLLVKDKQQVCNT